MPVDKRLLAEDFSSREYGLPCNDLRHALASANREASELERQLQASQADNQGKAIAGLLIFAPIFLTMDQQEAARTRLAEIGHLKDRLLRISQAKNCLA